VFEDYETAIEFQQVINPSEEAHRNTDIDLPICQENAAV
jgi:hypothetical protein